MRLYRPIPVKNEREMLWKLFCIYVTLHSLICVQFSKKQNLQNFRFFAPKNWTIEKRILGSKNEKSENLIFLRNRTRWITYLMLSRRNSLKNKHLDDFLIIYLFLQKLRSYDVTYANIFQQVDIFCFQIICTIHCPLLHLVITAQSGDM